MEAKVDPISDLASIIQYCFPSTLFGGDPQSLSTSVSLGIHLIIENSLG